MSSERHRPANFLTPMPAPSTPFPNQTYSQPLPLHPKRTPANEGLLLRQLSTQQSHAYQPRFSRCQIQHQGIGGNQSQQEEWPLHEKRSGRFSRQDHSLLYPEQFQRKFCPIQPGPASYKTEVSRKTSAVRIGKQNNQNVSVEFLNEKAINKNPGPGAYQSKVVKLKGGKITTKGARFEENKENRPGPGTYNTNYVPMDAVSKGGSRIRTSTITLDC